MFILLILSQLSCASLSKQQDSYGVNVVAFDEHHIKVRSYANVERWPELPTNEQTIEILAHVAGNMTFRILAEQQLSCFDELKAIGFNQGFPEYNLPLRWYPYLSTTYQTNLYLLPLANFKREFTTVLDKPQLNIYLPFDCWVDDRVNYFFTEVMTVVYHEIGHIEAIRNWPGGWLQPRSETQVQIDKFSQEVIAGQAEVCTLLLTERLKFDQIELPELWQSGKEVGFATLRNTLRNQIGHHSKVGREYGMYLMHQFLQSNRQQNFADVVAFCGGIWSPSAITTMQQDIAMQL